MQDLPVELFSAVCQQLDLRDLIRVAETCKRFRHGDNGLETVELPTRSPVVTALRKHAFPGGVGIPSTRPIGCSESWVAYLARCARQRRCREAWPIAAGHCSLFVDDAGQLLACGACADMGQGDMDVIRSEPIPVAALTGIRVRSVAVGCAFSFALSWEGRFFSWGANAVGQLGQGDRLHKFAPVLIEGLEDVRSIAAPLARGLAATQSGAVFRWGRALQRGAQRSLRPVIVEGFQGVRVRRVSAASDAAFAIGQDGEIFSWGYIEHGLLGHGDTQDQPSPKRVEALRGIRISSVSVGARHALALAEDGLVYTWGENSERSVLGNPHVVNELLPKPIEALRGVRAGSVAAAYCRSYPVADTGEVWAWGVYNNFLGPLGHGEQMNCTLPKPIESLRGIKVDAVAAGPRPSAAKPTALITPPHAYTLPSSARSSVCASAATASTLIPRNDSIGLGKVQFICSPWPSGLGPTVRDAMEPVLTPQIIPALRVSCAGS
jgi:hypothetical protein